jgi:hypothetical protein
MSDMMVMNPPGPSLVNRYTPPPERQTPSRDRLNAIVGRMQREVESRIAKRMSLEQRWMRALEQYHGEYDFATAEELRKEERSGLFINETGPKTDALAARLKDLLFPTDERNWGIEPTPVPELTENAEAAVAAAQQAQKQADEAEQATTAAQQDPNADPAMIEQLMMQEEKVKQAAEMAQQAADVLADKVGEARRRSDLMLKEIDDQLKECLYQSVKRDQIDCAVKLGTGVTKGPVTGDRVRRGWKPNPDGTYSLQISSGTQPAFRYVDIWGFFPDMDAKNINEGKGVYERYLMNSKSLRDLQFLDGFDKDAIRRLLTLAPSTTAPAYLAQLRNIRAASDQVTGDLYHVFEYTGPIEAEDMQDLAIAMSKKGDPTLALQGRAALQQIDSMLTEDQEIDILQSVNVCVWFCQGEILKFAVYPYDSGETMYSVFCLKRDEASIFGYGMPDIIRDPQSMLNGAVRAMMDNAGVSSGPQVIIDKQNMEPEDGSYRLKARKVWLAKNGLTKENPPFQLIHIDMHQAELGNIITMARQMIDIMSSMPLIAQGEQGANVTKTAQGMALLMNSTNVVFRSIVKNFDDDVTTPDIRRIYDFNMQHSKKQEIKGDYMVDARGSSVLLVREMQAQNLMIIALQLGAHPVYGPMLKNRELLKKLFQAHMIPSDEVMLKDSEIDAVLAKAAKENVEAQKLAAEQERQAQLMQLEKDKLDLQREMANQENHSREKIAKLNYDGQMMQTATRYNMTVEQLEAMLSGTKMKLDSDERKLAVEIAVEQRNAEEARARGEIPQGSGGSISGGVPKKSAATGPKKKAKATA